ncbi:phosphocholine-specific phospholipase C [Zhouia amylolytica]|uniref:phospholipase C n=1 Tax=Zhouia amylolytica AD3 TaxID=1286632 RepID=W2UQF0_9FLAO|nr:phospholipase C, phosphocholine-specific [Zhouia amylolytica]ETN95721.1 phospholipase C, phosphocholine-specific [Zhouia amylolytica AD3]
MDNRRDFLKKAAMVSGGLGVSMAFPPSIKKALAINPEEGSTFEDAEHVVLLMQENRSFDHCFGTLKGVRGFNDPRAISLPDKNPVWLQTNEKGQTFTPFRLNIKDTNATWMGDLPHSWENQVDARNDGKYDKWLEAKKVWRKAYKDIPFTLGYYNRQDIPFYYAFADAFTVFDQHFCSALTGTTTNRLYFWTGSNKGSKDDPSNVRNSEVYYNKEANWKTFPERLEEMDISWRIYQNEVSIQTDLKGDDTSLLGNFTDNPLEWFSQFNIRYAKGHQRFLKKRRLELPGEIAALKEEIVRLPKAKTQNLRNTLGKKEKQLQKIEEELNLWNPENYEKLSQFQKNIHEKAFTTNIDDPHYHQTETLEYDEQGEKRELKVPKGDILHQFRKDVDNGKMPTVSWLVAPQKFSDHPSAPWYGAWYVSEVLDILTKNPEIWKKTIFILTYDENDGYFDHVPPFVAPDPNNKHALSEGIDTATEFVTMDDEINLKGVDPKNARAGAIGLGYRVPLIVASPWTRGGWVNSEVSDITSTIQFLEKFISNKKGKELKETNISSWRRTISGDLTSAFRPYTESALIFADFVDRNKFMEEINNASFKAPPANFKALSNSQIELAKRGEEALEFLPRQEVGIKNSCPLNYQLHVDGILDPKTKEFKIAMEASNEYFGERAVGAPFNVYAPGKYLQKNKNGLDTFQDVKTWAFAVKSGDEITNSWPVDHFENKQYHLRVYGPNGFYREFLGNLNDPEIQLNCTYEYKGRLLSKLTGNVTLKIANFSKEKKKITIKDNAYKNRTKSISVAANKEELITLEAAKSFGWYDYSVQVDGFDDYGVRYAGRVETGKSSKTDPFMGRIV